MSTHLATPSDPRWHTLAELKQRGRVTFNLGEASDFAEDAPRGWWYWTSPSDANRYRGPFRSLVLAQRDRRRVRPEITP